MIVSSFAEFLDVALSLPGALRWFLFGFERLLACFLPHLHFFAMRASVCVFFTLVFLSWFYVLLLLCPGAAVLSAQRVALL